MNTPDDPIISIVITIVSDTLRAPSVDHLRSCLEALAHQDNPPLMEVIVPHQPGFTAIETLKTEFPEVRFLEIGDLKRYTGGPGSREHHSELRARGVAAARGGIIALTEDRAVADPAWCASIVEAHQRNVAAVGGAIENAERGLLDWAVYFREFGQYQNPVNENEPFGPSDVNASYKRSGLASIREIWHETFEEREVNWALRASGRRVIFSPRMIVCQKRRNLNLRSALRERWIWGRSYGVWQQLRGFTRLRWVAISPILPFVLVLRATVTILFLKRRNVGAFLKAFPLFCLITLAWCGGETSAYLIGSRKNRK